MPRTESTAPRATVAKVTTPPILLELVDENGATTGITEKLSAHAAPGKLHRAFSVFLFDDEDRLLMQRRSWGKYHSPGVWSNTCCGHPYPGEQPFVAAARRTVEELGAAPAELREAGTVVYNHPDPARGLVEHEYNHLFVGRIRSVVRANPEEVAETLFVTPADLQRLSTGATLSAWFWTILDAAKSTIREFTDPKADW
jgi:isopentenyl-diphosphate Delta-isomerase